MRVLECEYAHECSGACYTSVSVCVSGCCGTQRRTEREEERKKESSRGGEVN